MTTSDAPVSPARDHVTVEPRIRGAAAWEPGIGNHFPALDGIRGLAILLVMAFHLTVMTSTTRVDRMWYAMTGYGAGGVDLFFVLSGFLITGILYDYKGSAH